MTSLTCLDTFLKEQEHVDDLIEKFEQTQYEKLYSNRRQLINDNKISDFWSTVFISTHYVQDYTTFDDNLALDALKDFWIEWDKDTENKLTIYLTLADNPLFRGDTLSKCLMRQKNKSEDSDEEYYYSYTSLNSVDIKWNSDAHSMYSTADSFFKLFEYTESEPESQSIELQDRFNSIIRAIIKVYSSAVEIYISAKDDSVSEEYEISE